jgi:hypothetical protein
MGSVQIQLEQKIKFTRRNFQLKKNKRKKKRKIPSVTQFLTLKIPNSLMGEIS